MLKRLSQRELLAQVLADFHPQIRTAWDDAINSITSRIVMRNLVELLRDGDVSAAVRLLDIQDDDFSQFEGTLVQAYNGGGLATVNTMPSVRDPSGRRVVFSWGVRNLPTEQAMRRYAADRVTGIVAEQVDGIRSVLTENLARGQSPYDAGRMIAGRVNRVNGRREGGIIGLSGPQMGTVSRIRIAMREGDTAYMRQYLGFANRDKRLDGVVKRAIAENKPLSADQTGRLVRLYSNRALKFRADVISITETHGALARSKRDAYQQQIDAGKLDAADVVKTWRRTVSREPRIEHAMMAGTSVGFADKFTLPDGVTCDGPHDPTLPAKHTVNCKCMAEYKIDFTGQALRRYRERTGGR